jgi:hypothetical protein
VSDRELDRIYQQVCEFGERAPDESFRAGVADAAQMFHRLVHEADRSSDE